MSKRAAERQKEYEQRLRDDGYRRIQVWVKAANADKVKAFAAALREGEDNDR